MDADKLEERVTTLEKRLDYLERAIAGCVIDMKRRDRQIRDDLGDILFKLRGKLQEIIEAEGVINEGDTLQ